METTIKTSGEIECRVKFTKEEITQLLFAQIQSTGGPFLNQIEGMEWEWYCHGDGIDALGWKEIKQ